MHVEMWTTGTGEREREQRAIQNTDNRQHHFHSFKNHRAHLATRNAVCRQFDIQAARSLQYCRTMTIINCLSFAPRSSLPLHRSEPPATKRRKLNEKVEPEKAEEYNNFVTSMALDGDVDTTSPATCDDGNTTTMMEVELTAQDFVEMLLKVCSSLLPVDLLNCLCREPR